MYVLEANHLSKTYHTRKQDVPALQDISLQIRKGEMVAIMGPSGSGKTTLLHILSGIDRPDSGEIRILGQDLNSLSPGELALFRRRRLGMVFQDFQLLESLSVAENILLPLILDKQNSQEQDARLQEALSLAGIEELAGRGITELSGGQKQRVAIARALIQAPSLIFADEPTGNLDAETAGAILRCIADLNQKTQASMLLVTHDAYAASFCHRILSLNKNGISEGNRNGHAPHLPTMPIEKHERPQEASEERGCAR